MKVLTEMLRSNGSVIIVLICEIPMFTRSVIAYQPIDSFQKAKWNENVSSAAFTYFWNFVKILNQSFTIEVLKRARLSERTVWHDFHKIQCLLSSFVSAWCILRSVTSNQMNWHSISFYSMCPLCGYEVTCDVTKSFSKIYNMICVRFSVL